MNSSIANKSLSSNLDFFLFLPFFFPFLETSALTASNIDKAFNEMLFKVFVAFKPVEGENVEMEIEDKEMINLNGVTRVEKQSCC